MSFGCFPLGQGRPQLPTTSIQLMESSGIWVKASTPRRTGRRDAFAPFGIEEELGPAPGAAGDEKFFVTRGTVCR
jgi:hypothetical protein